MGQINESFAASLMMMPCLKGSVLEALIRMWAKLPSRVMSDMRSVVVWSYFVLCVEVYSDTLRNPKKAVVNAAQSITLSS